MSATKEHFFRAYFALQNFEADKTIHRAKIVFLECHKAGTTTPSKIMDMVVTDIQKQVDDHEEGYPTDELTLHNLHKEKEWMKILDREICNLPKGCSRTPTYKMYGELMNMDWEKLKRKYRYYSTKK